MNFLDCVAFANKNPIAWIATAEGDQPRVRALGMWFADESGFYFQTGAVKDLYKQLINNPKVELGFFSPSNNGGMMLRVSGNIEFLDNLELRKKCLNDRPFLKAMGMTPESPELIIFRLSRGEAHFWTIETSSNRKEYIKFGN